MAPLDPGYDGLDDETTLKLWVVLARRRGLHQFAFCHYWFNAQRILSAVGVDVDLLRLEQPREQILFCNDWAGGHTFWNEYMNFCEPVHGRILGNLAESDRRLAWSRADREIDDPYVSFIMERLFSTLLAVRPGIWAVACDAEQEADQLRPWHRRLFRRRPSRPVR